MEFPAPPRIYADDTVGLPERQEPTQRSLVAAMTIDGWTPKQIARNLSIGEHVVMFHLEQIAKHVPDGPLDPPVRDLGSITGTPV